MAEWIPQIGEKVLLECTVVGITETRELHPYFTVEPSRGNSNQYGQLVLYSTECLHPMKEEANENNR